MPQGSLSVPLLESLSNNDGDGDGDSYENVT